eukprot:UN17595
MKNISHIKNVKQLVDVLPKRYRYGIFKLEVCIMMGRISTRLSHSFLFNLERYLLKIATFKIKIRRSVIVILYDLRENSQVGDEFLICRLKIMGIFISGTIYGHIHFKSSNDSQENDIS